VPNFALNPNGALALRAQDIPKLRFEMPVNININIRKPSVKVLRADLGKFYTLHALEFLHHPNLQFILGNLMRDDSTVRDVLKKSDGNLNEQQVEFLRGKVKEAKGKYL
jgi:hypothetical protein